MILRVVVAAEDKHHRGRIMRMLAADDVLLARARSLRSLLESPETQTCDVIVAVASDVGEDMLDLLEAAHALDDRPDIIYLTGSFDSSEEAGLLTAGAMAVLSLGLPDSELSSALRSLLQRRRRDGGGTERGFGGKALEAASGNAGVIELLAVADRVAEARSSILIQGETGTGKEWLARRIHERGSRSSGPFVPVNCAALPEGLIEGELFGHARGAFTGAVRSKRGYFEVAHGGTLFLDEVGDIPAAMQVKLLRVLQDHVFQPLGTERSIQADVRVIAASNIPLEDAVQAGRFRKDLYYRLAVITLHAPPLRERPEDILPLAEAYARHFAAELGRPGPTLTQGARDMLLRYAWPGNVRELINVVERAVLLGSGPSIDVGDLPLAVSMDQPEAPTKAHLSLDRREASNLPPTQAPTNGAPVSYSDARRDALRAFEVQYFTTLLDQTGGRVGRVAELAGISQRSLFDKLRQYGIRKEDFRSRWGHAHG